MYTQALDLSNFSTKAGSTTASTATSAGSTQSQDRFLKLLVAQINSQDPLNPMDNAQMTTQMSQINMVSGIESVNDTLKSIASQFNVFQQMQGTALIGREALVSGNALGFDGNTGKAAFQLSGNASQVYVDVLDKSGTVIDTMDFGALTAGQHAFNWDGTGVDPTTVGSFRVRAANGGTPVTTTTFSRLTVTGANHADGALKLQLQNGTSLAYDKVSTFL